MLIVCRLVYKYLEASAKNRGVKLVGINLNNKLCWI